MQTFDVLLGEVVVGQLGRVQSGKVLFRFTEEYRQLPYRPVLGQHFEDNLLKTYSGVREELPAFFANLVPEGALRELLLYSLELTEGDDLQLLAALGHDLPGAVRIRPSQATTNLLDATAEPNGAVIETGVADEEAVFRFSLAGVQMKFSLLKSNEKLLLPTHNQQGDWIVKFDSDIYPGLVANEFATMEWARAAGFEVPECQVRPVSELPAELLSRVAPTGNVYLIKRYDRQGTIRIHQEDLAQVAGLRPSLKYEQWKYETCARVIRAICGVEGYEEFIRRLVFMVASGNTDAHLKNWSLLYPDGKRPVLTPLYDQVAVVAWPPPVASMKIEWALKFAGTKNLFHIDETTFERLAVLSGGDPTQIKRIVIEMLERLAESWKVGRIMELMPPKHVEALFNYWQRVPLLRTDFLQRVQMIY
ncbi:HipA domain-containing protein [Hymenobacter sp. ASUV-10]|uniref:HipA domain-containing protein n=1 Tax=Hymenobacter aranciens TaxID=3063996 RepID=A0ABT9B9X2_9BACT|nr:HipA domain-containing protein [Hymenobacter sp. ASUV-10]MDO7873837.1 HipA domain-containing protein [Hymenobacter sp. ASUV-10]